MELNLRMSEMTEPVQRFVCFQVLASPRGIDEMVSLQI